MTKPVSKPANRWLDVQIVIATMSLTFSMFLWNIFASAPTTLTAKPVPEPQAGMLPTETGDNSNPVTVPVQSFGRLLLGGSAPQSQSVSSAPVGVAPIPFTNTNSSRP